MFLYSQNADQPKETTKFTPEFTNIAAIFDKILDTMIESVQKIPRVEYQLFQSVEELDVQYISSVVVEEQAVLRTKQRIHAVINANSHGPKK